MPAANHNAKKSFGLEHDLRFLRILLTLKTLKKSPNRKSRDKMKRKGIL